MVANRVKGDQVLRFRTRQLFGKLRRVKRTHAMLGVVRRRPGEPPTLSCDNRKELLSAVVPKSGRYAGIR